MLTALALILKGMQSLGRRASISSSWKVEFIRESEKSWFLFKTSIVGIESKADKTVKDEARCKGLSWVQYLLRGSAGSLRLACVWSFVNIRKLEQLVM